MMVDGEIYGRLTNERLDEVIAEHALAASREDS
jgi:NADH:ubiquinone oxidoreductase subunit E